MRWDELNNNIPLDYILTYTLRIKYKLKMNCEQYKKLNKTKLMKQRLYLLFFIFWNEVVVVAQITRVTSEYFYFYFHLQKGKVFYNFRQWSEVMLAFFVYCFCVKALTRTSMDYMMPSFFIMAKEPRLFLWLFMNNNYY